jgi:hypothetical protein
MTSDVMTAPAAQEEGQEQKVQSPTFQEREQQIKEALAAFKKRQSAIATIRVCAPGDWNTDNPREAFAF